MPTPSDPVYRKIPEGYKKWPSKYTTCPSCGAIKTKASKLLCRVCQALEKPNTIEQPDDPSYRYIPLTRGKVAIVDTRDFQWLTQWLWYAKIDKATGKSYAIRNSHPLDGKKRTIWMHREILGLHSDDPRQGDHVTPAETLNNRRSNLRVASVEENQRNKNVYQHSKVGLKGVHLNKSGAFIAQISHDGKQHYLGSFETAEEAYASYCEAAIKYHGDFARFS